MTFLFIKNAVISQTHIHETDISDTSLVKYYVTEGDTTFTLKKGGAVNDVWIIYFDKLHLMKSDSLYYPQYGWVTNKQWFRNGQIKYYAYPVNILAGDFELIEWYSDGRIKTIKKCTNDSCVSYGYYQNGEVASKSIYLPDTSKRSMIWHYDAKYYENGQVKWTPFDPNGSRQTVINYYPSGSKHVQHDLWRMQRVGPYIEYYENGIVKVNGCYTDGEFIGYDVRGNKKTGKWSFYDESGKLIKEEWYENNVLLKTQNY